MTNPDQLEVEVKFLVPDLAAVRQRLLAAGGTVARPRVFERNLRLDTVDDRLLQRDELLRLRQDTAVTLTFKGRSLEAEQQSEAKVREELEVTVSNFETAVAIFGRLQLQPRQVYEKYREAFQLDAIEVTLDELPYGRFVELEGGEAEIKAAANRLQLDWSRRVVGNYLALFEAVKERHSLPFNDLTFANFVNLDVSVADVISWE